jgi:hypothetical protein
MYLNNMQLLDEEFEVTIQGKQKDLYLSLHLVEVNNEPVTFGMDTDRKHRW